MSERYITLLGAEQVQSAASRMASAADEMSRAAGNMDEVLHRHRLFMDDWLMRFESVIEKLTPTKGDSKMDKFLEAFLCMIINHPKFKEQLMLAVTEQLDGLELEATNIKGLDEAINDGIERADYSISVRT